MQTIFAKTALLPSGWQADTCVTIDEGGHIAAVSRGEAADSAHRVDVLLPALGNLHSHTFQRGMAGLAEARGPSERDSFWTWREVMYRFLDVLTPDEVEAIAAFAFLEMQEAGFGAVAEFHYLHNRPGGGRYDDPAELASRIAAAAAATGIGLTLLPVHYAQGGVDRRPLAGGQRRFANDIDSYVELVERSERLLPVPDWALGVAPHSLRAVGPDDLAACAALRPGAPLHMHIAEQEKEIEETVSVFGARPMQWLLDNHAVDTRWCLVHCTHMTPEETLRLAATGAVAGLCPVTEANLGDGIFDADRFLGADGRFGVGSDSNIRISTNEELRQLEYSQRLRDRARVVLAGPGQSAGRNLYERALSGGAQALGRNAGAIEAGRLADLVALDRAALHLDHVSSDAILDGWIFTAGGAGANPVSDLWSAGRHRVQGGRHIDRERISARYRTTMRAIMERL